MLGIPHFVVIEATATANYLERENGDVEITK
jgi:hypothetical protein